MPLHKSLIYALMAAVLGVLLVVVPLFFVSAFETIEGYQYVISPQTLSMRQKALEEAREFSIPNYSIGLVVFIAGFAVAVTAYFLVKAKFSH